MNLEANPIILNENHADEYNLKMTLNEERFTDPKYLERIASILEKQNFESVNRPIRNNDIRILDELYDFVVDFDSRDHYYRNKSMYQKLFNIYFLEAEEYNNLSILSSFLRIFLLFVSFHLKNISENRLQKLIKKLVGFVLIYAEPIATYSTKCLRMVFLLYNLLHEKPIKIEDLKLLTETLTCRLINLSKKNFTRPVENFYSKDCVKNLAILIEKNKNHVNLFRKRFEDLEFQSSVGFPIFKINITEVLSQRLQFLTFLYDTLPDLTVFDEEFINKLLELLYDTLNANECKSEALNFVAISIIYKCISFENFKLMFVNSDGILKICCTPYCLSSSRIIPSILLKLSTIENCMNYIRINSKYSQIMIEYMLDSFESRRSEEILNFFSNVFVYNEFFKHFNECAGLNKILKSMYKINHYREYIGIAADEEYNNENENADPLEGIIVYKSLKVIASYLLIKISSHSLLDLKCSSLRLTENPTYSSIVFYLDNIENPAKYNDFQFCQDLLSYDFLKWLFYVLTSVYKNSDTYDIKFLKNVFFLLYALSFYRKFSDIFLMTFKRFDNQCNRNGQNNFAQFIKTNLNASIINEQPVNYEIFKMYNNLIAQRFSTNDIYTHYIRGAFDEEYDRINTNLDIVIESCIENDLIYQAMHYMIIDDNTYSSGRAYCLKCLYLLSSNDRACQIILKHYRYFNEEIPKLMEKHQIMKYQTPGNFNFFKNAYRLVKRFNRLYKKSYHQQFSEFLCSIFNLTEQSDPEETTIREKSPIICIDEDDSKLFENNFESQKINSNETGNSQHVGIIQHPFKSLSEVFLQDQELKEKEENLVLKKNGDYSLTKNINTKVSISGFAIKTSCLGSNKYKIKETAHKINFNNYRIKDTVSVDLEHPRGFCMFDNDGNVIFEVQNGLRVYLDNTKEYILYPVRRLANHVRHSYNNQLLLASAFYEDTAKIETIIWKYTSDSNSKLPEPSLIIKDAGIAVFSHSNNILFSLSNDFQLQMIDVSNGRKLQNLKKYSLTDIYLYNGIDLNENDSLLYFNGDLFCHRSGKNIKTFERFNSYISGTFSTSFNEILAGPVLWDLRTMKLLKVIDDLKWTVMKRTFDNNILYGYPVLDDWQDRHVNFRQYSTRFGRTLNFYSPKYFNSISKKINFDIGVYSFDVNRHSTKFMTATEIQSHQMDFRIWELGYKN